MMMVFKNDSALQEVAAEAEAKLKNAIANLK
jgi:hypothetical protein